MTNPLGFMRMPYANLRSHRKLLIVDGTHAFAGGMNIREGFMSEFGKENTAKDTHFSIEGPAILQLFSCSHTTGNSPPRKNCLMPSGV
jgi:cardiolipin synthase